MPPIPPRLGWPLSISFLSQDPPELPRMPALFVRKPLAWLVILVATALFTVVKPEEQGDEFFEKKVRPILVSRCFDCHSGKLADGAKTPKGNLRLDSREAALKGGDTGPAVMPRKLKESLLVDAINYGQLYQMPPKTKLPAEEIATLTKWVEMGSAMAAGFFGND